MFMTRSSDVQCPGNGCVVCTDITTDQESPAEFPHTHSFEDTKMIAVPQASKLDWPEYALDVARAMVASGYEHQHHHYYPQQYLTGAAADEGRESIEVYFKPGPKHPTKAQPVKPCYPISPAPNAIPSLMVSPTPGKVRAGGEPIATHHTYESDDCIGTLFALIHCGPLSQGPKDCVHGGKISTLIDVLTFRCAVGCGFVGVTANLNINFRNVVPIGHVFVARVTVRKLEGRKLTAEAALLSLDHSVVYSEGTALFIRPRQWDENPELVLSKEKEAK